MSAIAIRNLPLNRALDVRAMSAITGGRSGLWALGAFVPYRPPIGVGPVANFYQTNNIFIADQLNIQLQSIAIENTAPNANISVDAGQDAINVSIG